MQKETWRRCNRCRMGIYSSHFSLKIMLDVYPGAIAIVNDRWFTENSRDTQIKNGKVLDELVVDTEEYRKMMNEDVLSLSGFDP